MTTKTLRRAVLVAGAIVLVGVGGRSAFAHHSFATFDMGAQKTISGTVKQVEIMDYRESYGHEVRGEAWRRQFIGKTAAQPVRLTRDIENIGGATLSSKNVTNGVRRLLHTWSLVLGKIA